MLERLAPKEWYERLWKIPVNNLVKNGIRGVIVDLDNTLVPWRTELADASSNLHNWLTKLKEAGLDICIVSNGGSSRVKRFADALDVKYVAGIPKPRRTPFKLAMAKMGTSPEETAVVGDQLFTDVLGGNRCGLYTILVSPQGKKEFVTTKLVRLIEKRVKTRLEARGLFPTRKGDVE
jgi:hypothetical protein